MCFSLKFKFKELLIIKHALQLYKDRPGVSDIDRVMEEKILNKIIDNINRIQTRYGIRKKEDSRQTETKTTCMTGETLIKIM